MRALLARPDLDPAFFGHDRWTKANGVCAPSSPPAKSSGDGGDNRDRTESKDHGEDTADVRAATCAAVDELVNWENDLGFTPVHMAVYNRAHGRAHPCT